MLKRCLFIALLLVLAGCSGNTIFSENFDTITELPEILTTDTLAAAPDTENRVLHLTVSEVVTLADGGHSLHEDRPEWFMQTVRDWLKKH